MNELVNSFIDRSVQCWGCPVFDHLFQVVSDAAAAVYNKFIVFCVIIFCVLFAVAVYNAVWKNIKDGAKDVWYKDSLQPLLINSVVALVFLGMGVALPRFITRVTFEPTAQITLVYTQSMVQTTPEVVNEKVTYQPIKISDDGFFRPQLRDTIILLMKTTITQFQNYIKLGIAVMDGAFSWQALLGVDKLLKHILMFCIGLALAYGFCKLFFRFCCYFVDIIVAMMFFAFFFPLSLVLVSFKNNPASPTWMTDLGKNVGVNQFKNLINAIVSLAAAVLTYTVIIVVIAKFFSSPDASISELMTKITSGEVFAGDLDNTNLGAMTLMSCIVLLYAVNYIASMVPKVTSMVMSAFDVGENHSLGDQLANDLMQVTKNVATTAKTIGQTIISGGEKTKDDGAKK